MEGQKSTTYNGGIQVGNVKAEGSVGQTQTVKGDVNIKRNGIDATGSYEQQYHAGGNVKVGKNEIGVKGGVSDKTFGEASVNVNNRGGSIKANVGKEYKGEADMKVNGREVKFDGDAKGQVNANIGFDKSKELKGLKVDAGVNGELKGEVNFLNLIDVKSGVKVDDGLNKGIHIKGGLNGGVDTNKIKTKLKNFSNRVSNLW